MIIKNNKILVLLFFILVLTIPSTYALSSIVDTYANSSLISGTYQTSVSGGNVHLVQYNASLGLSGYQSVRKITIDYTKIDEELTDFPILVYLNSSNIDWSKVQDDLDDLRFTQDNSTLLMAELDNFVVNNEAWIWVKIPSISSLVDTVLFMFYNNPSATSYWNPESVWDNNFVMVQHMKDATTSTILDSTLNNNDGTKKGIGEPLQTSNGKIDSAQNFSGADVYVSLPDSVPLNTAFENNYTISFWVNAQPLYLENFFVFSTSVGPYIVLVNSGGTSMSVVVYTGGNVYSIVGIPVCTGTWKYVTVKEDLTTEYLYVFINDVQFGNVSCNSGVSPTATNVISMSTPATSADFISDEFRISNISRSDAWIQASYYTETKQLQSYGSEANPALNYYPNGILYSTNLLLGLSSSNIDSFIYNATIADPGTIKIQFSENNVTWISQFGVSNTWSILLDGQHTLDMFNLEWSNHFYYRINITRTSLAVSPSLNNIAVYYQVDETATGTVQAILAELFYGSGSWLGLLILMVFIVSLCLAQRYWGLLMLPVTVYLGIDYLVYPTLMWNAIIMFITSVFVIINVFRKGD